LLLNAFEDLDLILFTKIKNKQALFQSVVQALIKMKNTAVILYVNQKGYGIMIDGVKTHCKL
jgi:flagellar biosynthesis/type III secretory pathway protein FliH